MKTEVYSHPALTECTTKRAINCIVSSVIQKSKFVQVIIAATTNERNIVFVPRKVFPSDITPGLCYCIKGEDRYKAYYGDIFISDHISEEDPSISLFFLYAAHNFHLLNKFVLQKIIEDDRQAFIQATIDDDIQYFVGKGLTPYVAHKFLKFSRLNLFWRPNEVIQIDVG